MVIKTIETDPNHDVIGKKFRAFGGTVFLCVSYDSSCGYWMVNVDDENDRRNVSERAIGRTFHQVRSK